MRSMPDNSVDSIVTDPPYEIGFMSKSWDSTGIAFNVEVWTEALRVLKPGGHLLAFSGSRTYHRMAVAIEDAGFQIRDQIMWLYGSGFPKSHNISKAIDKLAGAEREKWLTLPMQKKGEVGEISKNRRCAVCLKALASGNPCQCDRTETAITDEAQQWEGWGTALKPAHEPLVLARKPFTGTVAQNVLVHGTGALNIDASRISIAKGDEPSAGSRTATFGTQETVSGGDGSGGWKASEGRFPANIIHDGSDEVGELLGEPARFFYCPKANKKDRNEGLDKFEEKTKKFGNQKNGQDLGNGSVNDKFTTQPSKNNHPTVKPTDLMRYLVKLITPPNGIVLDPFMGSGSTGKGAVIEGFNFIGIELDSEYIAIANARIQHQLDNKEDN